MENMPKYRMIIRIAGFLFCVLLLVALATVILKPKRLEPPYDNTRKERGFYLEEKNSLDLVFVGSSQVFASMVPSVLMEEQGINSYVLAGNEQPFSISYYYIMEVLKYQKPKAIVLETTFCNWGEMPRDSVVRINFDDMRWGKAKLLGIMNNVLPKDWEYFFFELSKYHSRWDMLTGQDFDIKSAYYTPNETKGWSAYSKTDDADKSYGETVDAKILTCTERKELDENAMMWLQKIEELCEKEKVQLILLKTPNNGQIAQPAQDKEAEEAFEYIDGMAYYNSLEDYAKEKGIPFLNMNLIMPGTNHNDVENAKKATSYFGEWVKDYMD